MVVDGNVGFMASIVRFQISPVQGLVVDSVCDVHPRPISALKGSTLNFGSGGLHFQRILEGLCFLTVKDSKGSGGGCRHSFTGQTTFRGIKASGPSLGGEGNKVVTGMHK
ncbi:hypothetical protein U1Q18_039201 [Sarracenia purpurea var. burkii]